MLRKLSISKRFGLILFLIFILTLPVITTVMYYFFRENAIREVADKALLTMHAMESVRKYVVEEVRPVFRKEAPNKFLVQGMSGVYAIRKVSANLRNVQHNYSYKQATTNPRAPENRADDFEEKILAQFRTNTSLKELAGIRLDRIEPLYYIARPVTVDRRGCLTCHSSTSVAPKAVVKKYGMTAGYNYKMHDVMGANIIYVPASVPIAIAKRSTAMVAVVFTGLFFLLFVIITSLIRKNIIRPIENFVGIADQVSKGKFDNKFDINTQDELKTLADAFTRLKTSLVMMMDMVRKQGVKK